MIKAVIVDDDAVSIELLRNLLQDVSDIQVVKSYTDSLKFLKEKRNLSYDVVFLDIEMPNIDGIELQRGEKKPVVFVSGESGKYVNEISDALNRNDVTFITKPLSAQKVADSVFRLKSWVDLSSSTIQLETNLGTSILSFADIQAICSPKLEVANRYGTVDSRDKVVFVQNSKPLVLKRHGFEELILKLPGSIFCQISSQVIVSRNYLKTYRSQDLDLMLFNGAKTTKQEFSIGKEFNANFRRFASL